jgi:hypothetical protein
MPIRYQRSVKSIDGAGQRAAISGHGAGLLNLAEERAKLARELAEAAKLKSAIARAEYVQVEVVGKFMEGEYGIVREKNLTLIGKCSDRLSDGDPERRAFIETVLGQEVHEILNELSNPADIDFSSGSVTRKRQESSPGAEAAPEAKPDRVGEPVPPRSSGNDS